MKTWIEFLTEFHREKTSANSNQKFGDSMKEAKSSWNHYKQEHHGKTHHGKTHHGKTHHGKRHHGKTHHKKRHHVNFEEEMNGVEKMNGGNFEPYSSQTRLNSSSVGGGKSPKNKSPKNKSSKKRSSKNRSSKTVSCGFFKY
jgi:hypothetical protein